VVSNLWLPARLMCKFIAAVFWGQGILVQARPSRTAAKINEEEKNTARPYYLISSLQCLAACKREYVEWQIKKVSL